LLTLSSTYSFANVDFKDPSIPLWEINGQISKSDVKKVEDAAKFATKNRMQAVFRLNTEGGDVEAAIAIGRQLRNIRAFALTFEQGRC
jgi:membrane-bound ClpP family serine protease